MALDHLSLLVIVAVNFADYESVPSLPYFSSDNEEQTTVLNRRNYCPVSSLIDNRYRTKRDGLLSYPMDVFDLELNKSIETKQFLKLIINTQFVN